MARLIVYTRDLPATKKEFVGLMQRRGYVIDAVEDGCEVGREVERLNLWRVVEVPGVPVSEFALLFGEDPYNSTTVLMPKARRMRVYRLDLDSLEKMAGLQALEHPNLSITVTRADIKAATLEVEPEDNPFVIGEEGIG